MIVVMPLRSSLPGETTKVPITTVISVPIIGTIRSLLPNARLSRISNEVSMTV